eukprot:TRINITY_DN4384_c0_g2_i1.p1 TRINITY_DN4384_c0_g2~~TRINITY_DN4384_c0_g2_i1.p1  ORF type:complete len:290 (+),score=45.30 TRINITY_DN4384_c0_g2_i1:2-871(+)
MDTFSEQDIEVINSLINKIDVEINEKCTLMDEKFYELRKEKLVLEKVLAFLRPPAPAPAQTQTLIEPHRFEGVFIARRPFGDFLVTLNSAPGDSLYGEKLLPVGPLEYRTWNPFRSNLAAGILGGVSSLHISPGKKVLYLGAASGATVSHVSDMVGASGAVYAVEFSVPAHARLSQMAQKRPNVFPICQDARDPKQYQAAVPQVDVLVADLGQPDQSHIVGLNAKLFLRSGGGLVVVVDPDCIDSSIDRMSVFAGEVKNLKEEGFKPREQLTLEPYSKSSAMIVGIYQP